MYVCVRVCACGCVRARVCEGGGIGGAHYISLSTLLSAEGQSLLLFYINQFTSTSITHQDFKNE